MPAAEPLVEQVEEKEVLIEQTALVVEPEMIYPDVEQVELLVTET